MLARPPIQVGIQKASVKDSATKLDELCSPSLLASDSGLASKSWKEVLVGKDYETSASLFSPGEGEMISGLCRFFDSGPWVRNADLFPEINSLICRTGFGLMLTDGERIPSEFLFPEVLSLGCDFSTGVGLLGCPASERCILEDALGVCHTAGVREEAIASPHEVLSLPRGCEVKASRPRGRPRLVEKSGRKKKDPDGPSRGYGVPEGSSSLEAHEGNQRMLLPAEFSEPHGVMTRAMSALLMGKRLGMSYDCTDATALNQIAAQIQARKPP